MGLRYDSLDNKTVGFMLPELDRDLQDGSIYISPRLTPEGRERWPDLLRSAITDHGDDWLADTLADQGLLARTEQRRKKGGGYSTVKVPVTAGMTLAEGEFNRYYARGVCSRAVDEGIEQVEVYRGKPVSNPRSQSQALIGKRISAAALLADLRSSKGVEPALGVPPGPNSGLTVRLPQ